MDHKLIATHVKESHLQTALRHSGEGRKVWENADHLARRAFWRHGELAEGDRMQMLTLGYLATVLPGGVQPRIEFAPVVEMDAPRYCYHATPCWSLIEASGQILTGDLAAQSTTGYAGAGNFIHVSLSVDDASTWVTEYLAGHAPGRQFKVIEIDAAAMGCNLIRDSASQTGWLLSVDRVPVGYFRLVGRVVESPNQKRGP